VLGAGGWGGGLAAGVLWFCVGGCWWLAGGLATGGLCTALGFFVAFVLHWVLWFCVLGVVLLLAFPFFHVYYIWAGRRYMWRVGPMREIPVCFICRAGLDAFLPFVEFSMCHAILSIGTICFCSPMLGFLCSVFSFPLFFVLFW
jgi:hypothetical protein